jgi:hypothetical protein
MKMLLWLVLAIGMILGNAPMLTAEEPQEINPFKTPSVERDDAMPGYIELSDGSIYPGQIYLTRDKRLKISDDQLQRQREIPLNAVKQIDCTIKKEWLEKEWKFKELTQDEKMYTGRTYPTREYAHTITLNDGRTISGGLSAIVYVKSSETKAVQFILNKRNKGEIGQDLQSLVYVKSIKLGKEAYEEGKQKVAEDVKKVKKK